MAIAFDAQSSGNAQNTNTVTVAHTCSGNNRILFVNVGTKDGGEQSSISSVTYNGVAMTAVAAEQSQASAYVQRLFYLIAPATGTNNIVATVSAASTDQIALSAASYTGVLQVSPLTAAQNQSNDNATTLSASFTSTANNSYGICGMCHDGSNTPAPTGSETVRLVQQSGAYFSGLEDVAVPLSGAGVSMGWGSEANTRWMVTAVGFNPAAEATTGASFLLKMV